MKAELQPDESILKEGPANLRRGIESVGGRLTVTSQRLVFEPHKVNVQKAVEEIARDDVASVANAWPTALTVKTHDGRTRRFKVYRPTSWREVLTRAHDPALRESQQPDRFDAAALSPDSSGASQPEPNAGAKTPADPLDRVQKLGELHASGLLTDDEFEAKKRLLLDRL